MDKQASLSAERQKLLAQRLKKAAAPQNEPRRIPLRPEAGSAPLSFAQHQLWVVDQMTPGNTAYSLPVAYRVSGPLDAQVLEDCFNAVIQRHEILRTTFREIDGDAVQEIHPACKIRVELVDLTQLPPADREDETKKRAAEEGVKPFDLRSLPLLRASLFKLGGQEHVLLINIHHLIADGVSLNLLLEELDAHYRAAISNTAPQVPVLAVQFGDFAAWQKAELAKPRFGAQLDYWRQQLGNELPLLEFGGGEKPVLHRQSFHGSNESFRLSSATIQALSAVGTAQGCTLFVTILAAVQVILQRYSQAAEIVIGTPIANRPLPELDPLIGNFVNIVALRCGVSGNPTFPELLQRSKDTTFNALSNKDIPFEMLVKDLRSHHNPAHNPVFQVLLQILPAGPASLGGLAMEPFDFELKSTQVDLALHLYEQSDGAVLGKIQYCRDLFAANTIESFAQSFVQLLDEIAKAPQRPVLDFPIAELPPASLDARPETAPGPLTGEAPVTKTYAAPQTSIQSQLAEIWEEVLHRRQIGIHDDFFALGGHSLLVARMLAIVEERLGVRLSFSSFFVEATIESMASLMQDRQRAAAENQSWVLLNPNGTQRPFFFLHGDFNGGGFFCRALARYSGEDRPFYAIHPPGLHGDPIPITIEDIATLKLQELRKIQPTGPYLLGGYCNGGLVAYEMARRIEAEDGEKSLVIMLMAAGEGVTWRGLKRVSDVVSALRGEDAAARQQRFLRWKQNMIFLRAVRNYYVKAAGRLIKQPPTEQIRRVCHKLGRIFRRLFGIGPATNPAPTTSENVPRQETYLSGAKIDAYARAFGSYVPGRFGGRVIHIWPEDEKLESLRGPSHGWDQMCREFRGVLVPGDHDTCIERDANLRAVGEEIGRALAEF